MKTSLRLSGAMVFELCALIVLGAMIAASVDLPPRTRQLPLIVAWLTIGLICLDLLLSLRKQLKRAASGPPKPADADTAKRTIGSVVFMAAMVALWNVLGFISASILATVGFALFLGVKNKLALVISSLGLTLLLYYIFGILLRVPLPKGVLP